MLRGGRMVVDDVPDPVPADGQVLVETKACGICGSDLHAAQHADRMVELTKEATSSRLAPLSTSVEPNTDTNRPGALAPAATCAAQASVIPRRTSHAFRAPRRTPGSTNGWPRRPKPDRSLY